MNLFSLGLSFKTAPVTIREQFSVSENELYGALCKMHQMPEISECMILSTCNRTEFLIVPTDNIVKSTAAVYKWIEDNFDLPYDWKNYVAGLTGIDALRHIFRIGCGIESEIVGEPQILGQLKDAYRASVETRTSGVLLNRIMRRTFMVSKIARTQTKIGNEPVSISFAAAVKVKEAFEKLSDKNVMMIGAGNMIELAAKYLFTSGAKISYIANRTFSNACRLSDQYGALPLHLSDVRKFVNDVDIIISCTGSKNFIIDRENLHSNKELMIIDIAVPRNVDPAVGDFRGITLYNIDDLRSVVNKAIRFRKQEAKKADIIVDENVKSFLSYIGSMNYEAVIKTIRSNVEKIRTDELQEALKVMGGDLSMRERQVIDKLTKSIIEKVLYQPTKAIRKYATDPEGDMYIEAIKQMYGISNQKSSDIKCFFVEAKENIHKVG